MKKSLFFSYLVVLSVSSYAEYRQEEFSMTKRNELKAMHCVPCEGGVAPLNRQEISEYLVDFSKWKLLEHPYRIERAFMFKNFAEAMKFVNEIAQIAEAEGHHPDITIVYNKVTIQLFTHAIQGLSVNDFILAGLIDEVYV